MSEPTVIVETDDSMTRLGVNLYNALSDEHIAMMRTGRYKIVVDVVPKETDAVALSNRITELGAALLAIAALGGTLSDDQITTCADPNDAAQRGMWYTEARRLAYKALEGKP